MSIQVESTKLYGVFKVQPPTVYEDFRGVYLQTWNKELYSILLPDGVEFVQDDVSISKFGVLRGLHGDDRTWKLVSCLFGRFYLVVLDYDKDSPTYKQWQSFTLSDKNNTQILIPPLRVNGHMVLSETAMFAYKQSTYYQGASQQMTILWNDPEFNIFWPIRPHILSRRDCGVLLEE